MLTGAARASGKGVKFFVRITRGTKKTLKAILEIQKRMAAIRRMTPYLAAQMTAFGVQGRIPRSPDWNAYQKSVKLVREGPARADNPTFVAYAKPTRLKNRDIDTARSVLYVRAKKTVLGKVPKEVLVLAKFNPWTADTLPFSPKKNQAVIVVRKAKKREVQSVAEKRKKDEPEWRKELNALGIREIRKQPKIPELKTKIISDLAFDALRLEFGLGGTKPVPHWRPAIKESLSYVKRLYRHRSFFTRTMSDPSYQAWRKWPPKVGSTIKIDELKSLMKFSKRLHVRV